MDFLNVEGNWQETIVHLFILDQVMQIDSQPHLFFLF
jgi:hypothetical protein